MDEYIEQQKTNIKEYAEGYDVYFEKLNPEYPSIFKHGLPAEVVIAHKEKRLVVRAFNEGGHNSTAIDLVDVLKATKEKFPELWEKIGNE